MSPAISLTMIVRDEAANLPACLASCADLFDELVIVDTGSTDSTKAIAAAARDKHGRPARVFDFEWCDDFAAARNESLKHATGDWVFWMDADDRLDPKTKPQLESLLANLPASGEFAFLLASQGADGRFSHGIPHVRLFSRSLERHWAGRIHEVLSPVEAAQVVEIWIQHVGYQSPARQREKCVRNLRLLEQEFSEHPERTELLYYFGREYGIAGEIAKSLDCLKRCKAKLDESNEWPTYYAVLRLMMGFCYGHLRRWDELAAVEEEARLSDESGGRLLIGDLQAAFPIHHRYGSLWGGSLIA